MMGDSRNQNLIQEAIRFIELHLNEELGPQRVAAHVGFSEFHFHRIFQSALHESVSEYIRKRRLVEAARRLVQTDAAILEVALRCHFESQESFTRAFKKHFGYTPGSFRKAWSEANSADGLRRGSISESICESETPLADFAKQYLGENCMEPKIVFRNEELAVGMGGSFIPKSVPTINQLWNKFLARRGEIKDAKPGIALGICSKHHPSIEREGEGSIVYVAAVPVTSIEHNEIPVGMVACTLTAGTYAVFTHRGPLRNLPETCDYIWGEWASSGKLKLRDSPDFELYDERFDSEKLDGEIDIYVPIE